MSEDRKPTDRRVRSGPTLGSGLNISVPISIGLPLIAVGIALLVAAGRTGKTLFWITGTLVLGFGLALFASGRSL